MEVRLGAELGLKNTAGVGLKKIQTKVENYANLPGRDMNNRQATATDKAAGATKPSQAKDQYKILGNTVNIQA